MTQAFVQPSSFDTRLNEENLALIPQNVMMPGYDRSALTTGIVHIGGASNFFRSHLAVYMDDLMQQGKGQDFGIYAVSMRSPQPVADLNAQNCLYTIEARDTDVKQTRVIGSITESRYLPDHYEHVLNTMAAQETKIYSLTITQPGYCQNTKTGGLDTSHVDIRHDLMYPQHPHSAIGLIVEALHRRFEAGHEPVTILSCDNLPANGRLLQRMVSEMAAQRNEEGFSQWIENKVAFPVTTVDRIAPVTTDEFRQDVRRTLGFHDTRPVLTEPFREFVIEDKFANDRPPFEEAGVKMVQNPDAFWSRKFGLLNTGHTLIATLAQRVGGLDHIDEAMTSPLVHKFVRGIMDQEITPLLPQESQTGIDHYKDALLKRFSNTALKDRVDRVGAEGSRKIPKYVFSAIRQGLNQGTSIDGLSLVAAAWIHGLGQKDEQGRSIELRDPKLGQISGMGLDLVSAALSQDKQQVAQILNANSDFFGLELAKSEKFQDSLAKALLQVGTQPMQAIMKAYCDSQPAGAKPAPTLQVVHTPSPARP